MLSVGEACVLLCLCTLTHQVKFRSHVGACHLLFTTFVILVAMKIYQHEPLHAVLPQDPSKF